MPQANAAARIQSSGGAGLAAIRRVNRIRLLRPLLMLGGVLAVLLAVLFFWLTGGQYVTTDDAYVDAAKVALSTDVSGLVDQVYVHDNQHVQAGDPLFRLGQSAYGIAVAQGEADVAQALMDVNAAKHAYAQALAMQQTQRVLIEKDAADVARYASVVDKGGVTRAVYDDARFTLAEDQSRLNELQQAAGLQLAKLQDNPAIAPQDTPEYQQAMARLNNAQRDLAHTVLRAPYSGTVTNVESLQPGMFLPAGTAAFGLVSDTDVFITAQPKEDQLTWVRPGQLVTVSVDAYPGQQWQGVVQSLSPASGSEFSILPAQNSSGNWVKVVQRIPLRVQITSGPKNLPLRAGMSTEITIDTKHHRHFADLF